ncbi:MAG: DUF2919 domain-containing protein [Alteromonadaceae bacterium]|nr:DUF2919 domain-containing protein [Alteromonadaceae bacterium]
MTRHSYAEYSIEDFDKFDCLKLSKGFYLLLLFVLRGYIVWIMSLTNRKDSTAIMEFFFPDPSLFYLSLSSGVLGLFVVLIMSLRRPDAANWVKVCWRYCRAILMLTLVSIVGCFYWDLLSMNWILSQTLIVSLFVIFCYKSHRFNINLKEFPDKLPEK